MHRSLYRCLLGLHLPADFRGHWSGNFQWPAPAGQVELVLDKSGDAWTGDLAVRGPDGIPHHGAAEDLCFDGGAVSFRVRTKRGPLRFHGRVAEGKLTGALQPADGSSF